MPTSVKIQHGSRARAASEEPIGSTTHIVPSFTLDPKSIPAVAPIFSPAAQESIRSSARRAPSSDTLDSRRQCDVDAEREMERLAELAACSPPAQAQDQVQAADPAQQAQQTVEVVREINVEAFAKKLHAPVEKGAPVAKPKRSRSLSRDGPLAKAINSTARAASEDPRAQAATRSLSRNSDRSLLQRIFGSPLQNWVVYHRRSARQVPMGRLRRRLCPQGRLHLHLSLIHTAGYAQTSLRR